MKFTEEEISMDNEFAKLLEDVHQEYLAIDEDSTITINGKYIPNSRLALEAAQNLLRISEILKHFEKFED